MAKIKWFGKGEPPVRPHQSVRVWLHDDEKAYEGPQWCWNWDGEEPVIGCIVAYELIEVDPHGRDPKEPGSKLDAGKSPVRRGLLEYFPRACMAVADISLFGAQKYAWKGWETVPDGIDRYGDAEVRHICNAAIEGPITKDSQKAHAAHEAWNALARLELILREQT